ncbi:unnamed protein product [Soboliphyme baturini]|uniref:Cell division cycle protein 27 homolog n=1 Tax=Soboliphyme baturini TaxID=241478 RepID=A0A183IS71_9BILA|nr:unnamed protein product [Soboliphyme baturini]
MEDSVRACWEHYAYDDAIFISEVYFAETSSEHALFLLASSYYRSGQVKSAYYLLRSREKFELAGNRFLFAKCCEALQKCSEAVNALVEDGDTIDSLVFGRSTGFVHSLLGKIYARNNRIHQAKKEHVKALQHIPYLFSSLQDLSELYPFINLESLQTPIDDLDIGIDSRTQGPAADSDQCSDSFKSSTPIPCFGLNHDGNFKPLGKAPRKENAVRRDIARPISRRARPRKFDLEKIDLNDMHDAKNISSVKSKSVLDFEMYDTMKNDVLKDDPTQGLRKYCRDLYEIEIALNQFECTRAIQLLSQLPATLQLSPFGLTSAGRSYYEQANYSKKIQHLQEEPLPALSYPRRNECWNKCCPEGSVYVNEEELKEITCHLYLGCHLDRMNSLAGGISRRRKTAWVNLNL